MAGSESFPRELTTIERDLLSWILPPDRSGYKVYRDLLDSWKVIAQGRRGEGNYILGRASERPDNESPLPQVLAYGMVETSSGKISVSIRERLGDQVEYEIVNLHGEVVPDVLEEARRWTFSTWLPSQGCPVCSKPLREVPMQTKQSHSLVLAICRGDERLWIYDRETGINHPMPATNFYNELMLHRNIRDPKVALDSKRLFRVLDTFSDSDLQAAFVSYNKIRTKVQVESEILVEPEKKRSFLNRLLSKLSSRS